MCVEYRYSASWNTYKFLIIRLARDPLNVTSNLIFRTVSAVVQNWPPVSYIVAVERKLISQDEIVKV